MNKLARKTSLLFSVWALSTAVVADGDANEVTFTEGVRVDLAEIRALIYNRAVADTDAVGRELSDQPINLTDAAIAAAPATDAVRTDAVATAPASAKVSTIPLQAAAPSAASTATVAASVATPVSTPVAATPAVATPVAPAAATTATAPAVRAAAVNNATPVVAATAQAPQVQAQAVTPAATAPVTVASAVQLANTAQTAPATNTVGAAANTAATPAPAATTTTTASTPTPTAAPFSGVATGAAAAAEPATDPVIRAMVDSLRPKATVPPLENDRFVFYLSDEVSFAQLERNSSRYGFEDGRAHLAVLYSEERDTVVQGGLSLDASFARSFRLSIGARAYAALLSMENMDAFAMAFGAEAAYQLPFESLPLELATSFYYAPDVLSFGAGDRVLDVQVDVSIPFRSQLSVFTGIRYLQVDTRPDDREVDNRLHIGIRWDFL